MNNLFKVIIIYFALSLLSLVTLYATEYYAVCVGIRNYPGTENDITSYSPINDCDDMSDYLIQYQGWNSANILQLKNSQATKTGITNSIQDMPNNVGNSELFSYTGHGSTRGLFTYSEDYLSPSDLSDAFGSSYNQYCCFIDACHSGVFVEQMTNGEISSACASTESAYAGGPGDNSVYHYYILEGIKNNQADPISGHVVSAEEIHYYAASDITSYNSLMHPEFVGNIGVLNLSPLGPTTSGSLIDDELWDQDIALIGNVTIPSGVKLIMQPGITITVGSYSITSSGGTITVASGATINSSNSHTRLVTGSTINGIYSTIAAAMSEASSGQTVEVYGPHTQSSSLTISSGKTMTFKSGATISFPSGYSLVVNGTLNASGTSASRATFTRSGTSGTWGGIQYQSGSSGSLQYAYINYATYGVYANNSSPTISNSTISNCSYGVYSYYGSPTVSNNSIGSCTYGAYLNHAGSAVVNTNAITGCTRGIYGYYAGLPVCRQAGRISLTT